MYQWIEYSLIFLNGQGIQPYETLVPLGVNFDGGHYVQEGRYRGRLSGNALQIENAVASLGMFGTRVLSDADILAIVEECTPTNTQINTDRPDNNTPKYIGPPSLDVDGRVVRTTSDTPF